MRDLKISEHCSKSLRILSSYLIGDPQEVKWPLSFQQQHVHVASERHTWSQCKQLLFFLFPALKLKSGLLDQLIGQKYLVANVQPLWSQNWRLLHIQLFFFHSRQSCSHQFTRFPQNWSQDRLTILLGVLSNGAKFLGKSEREPSGLGRMVAVLRTSQENIVRPGFSISTT